MANVNGQSFLQWIIVFRVQTDSHFGSEGEKKNHKSLSFLQTQEVSENFPFTSLATQSVG